MPMPRHIRLRQHSRIRKPARVAGLFDFQLHEARVKEGIAKVTVDRRGLKREAASTVSQFVNTFVPQLRYWNPSVPVTLVDGKVDKAPEAAVIITHASGETEVVPLTPDATAESIFAAVSDSKLPEPKLKAIARHIEVGRAYDVRKRAQLRAERSNKASSKSAAEESSERA